MPVGVLLYHTHNSFPLFGEWGADIPACIGPSFKKITCFLCYMRYIIKTKGRETSNHKCAEKHQNTNDYAKTEKSKKHKEIYEGN